LMLLWFFIATEFIGMITSRLQREMH
jgi:phosphate starvation-inducible membrane PsiE